MLPSSGAVINLEEKKPSQYRDFQHPPFYLDDVNGTHEIDKQQKGQIVEQKDFSVKSSTIGQSELNNEKLQVYQERRCHKHCGKILGVTCCLIILVGITLAIVLTLTLRSKQPVTTTDQSFPTAQECARRGEQEGIITVSMSWISHDIDLDLLVYEPDQTFVYFRNLSGSSGYLVKDFLHGPGPQVYRSRCVFEGTYKFEVRSYEGQETATFVGVAGGQNFTKSLIADNRQEDQTSFTLSVSRNRENGTFIFRFV